jgi:hypothetical protein
MTKLKLKSSYWIVNERNQIIIGKGRMEILDNIEKTGSINQAAKIMKMSYKAVWSKIKFTEKHLNITDIYMINALSLIIKYLKVSFKGLKKVKKATVFFHHSPLFLT